MLLSHEYVANRGNYHSLYNTHNGLKELMASEKETFVEQLNIKIISDLICPWCYIARTRIEQILVDNKLQAQVEWLPYELNPSMPPEGLDRKEYRSKKFGSWEHSQNLDRSVVDHGQPLGLTFHYDKVLKTPNTLLGHKLIWIASTKGLSDQMAMRLFKAYFEEGFDIGDLKRLKALGKEVGLKDEDMSRLESRSEFEFRELHQFQAWIKDQGIASVPYIVVNDQYAFTGAQSDESIKAIFFDVLGRKDEKDKKTEVADE